MLQEHGNLAIHTENIFPIIKKWLYSDKDIFIRELISNSCDAISKLKQLHLMGEAQVAQDTSYHITVRLDEENKTIQVIDNGIGMTDEEVKKYINQIAFSGAEDFVQKYKDKTDGSSEIIGHFGLGFYSSFMVADKVRIDTLSYREGAQAVSWECEGGTEYDLGTSEREQRGTTITLFIGEDGKEFLDAYTLRSTIEKYCAFMPVEIYFENVKEDKENNTDQKPLNDPHPLWMKDPKECTEEEYKTFYKKVFHDFNDPLFWIHLNMDYPFRLKGILYFPKLRHEFESSEGQIQLYNNQVFVANNIKEVIPEFLLLLKGTLDCPDLPLNVSRSFLQNDGYVRKISDYITKKVADKLNSVYKKEKENYEKFWDDINPFIKYGCMRESKFHDKVKDIVIYKTTNEEYVTLKEYLERNNEKHENKVYYVTDEKQQAQYVNLFKEQGLEAVILTSSIDSHFITHLEMKEPSVRFERVDSDLSETLKENENAVSSEEKEALQNLFKDSLHAQNLKIEVEALKSQNLSAVILLSEQARRMQDMSKMFGNMGIPMMEEEKTLVLNRNHPLIQKVLELQKEENQKETVELICQQVYDLARMAHQPLESAAMTRFIERSNELMLQLA